MHVNVTSPPSQLNLENKPCNLSSSASSSSYSPDLTSPRPHHHPLPQLLSPLPQLLPRQTPLLVGPPPSSPCSFTGVTCDPSSHVVVGVNLSNHRLRGPLPPSLSHLCHLRHLSLSSNSISGHLLALSLPTLLHLNISNNNLTGTFPISLSFPCLQTLDAYNNNFFGPVPTSLSSPLRHLQLGRNFFSPQIPSVSIPSLLPMPTDRETGGAVNLYAC